jgi:hypothetical protein
LGARPVACHTSLCLGVRLGEDCHLGARPVACHIGLRLGGLGVHGGALESEIAWGCLVSLQVLPPSAPQAKAPPSDVKIS